MAIFMKFNEKQNKQSKIREKIFSIILGQPMDRQNPLEKEIVGEVVVFFKKTFVSQKKCF